LKGAAGRETAAGRTEGGKTDAKTRQKRRRNVEKPVFRSSGWVGRARASRSKGATGRARRRADFQGLGPALVRGERPHESGVGGTGAKRVPGRETTKTPARSRPRVDPSHGERDTTTCVERRRARERGAKKGEGLLKFLIWGSRQKAKTGQEKASSRYGARTHDFFACGGHRKRRPELAMKLPVALTVPLPTSPPHNDRFCSLL